MSKLPSKEVDSLIVGAGFAGLLAAALRAKSGKKVLIVEASPQVGGRWSPEERDGFQLGAGIIWGEVESWKRIYDALEIPFQPLAIANGKCMLYSARGWQEPRDFSAWENYFARNVTHALPRGLAGFMQDLLRKDRFTLDLEAPLTELYSVAGRVQSALIGTKYHVEFSECIWAADAKALMEVLQGEGVPEMGTARVAWMKQFVLHAPSPGVVLEFAHSSCVSDFSETLALPFSGEEGRHILGAFLSNRDASLAPAGKQISSWIFALPEEIYEDNHEVMKRIRAAHRTLDKCFPGFEKSLLFDRIQVLPHTVTPLRTKKKQAAAAEILPNLVAVSDWSSPLGAHFEGVMDRVLTHAQ